MKPQQASPAAPASAPWTALVYLLGVGCGAWLIWLSPARIQGGWWGLAVGTAAGALLVLTLGQRRRGHQAVGAASPPQPAMGPQEDVALLAMVARQTTHAVVITDAQRRITWVNRAFERVTEYRAEEVIGRSPGELLQCAQTDPGVVQRMREALDAGRPFLCELVNRSNSGRMYWIELDIQPIRDIGGALTGFMALQADITARRKAESDLRSSQSFLDKAGRIGGVGGWQLRLPSQDLAWTDQTARILDEDVSTAPTVLGLLAFMTPEIEALLQPLLKEVAPSNNYWDLELPLRTAKGRDIWVRLVVECEYADGGVTGLVGAIQDITVRRAMKAEVKRSAELLRGAIDTIDEGFVLFDPQDRLVLCNERFRQLYATTADMLVPGTSFEAIIREGVRRGQYVAAMGHEEAWIRSRLAMHREGNATLVQHLDNGRVLRILERRMPDGHIVSFRIDITDLIQATEEAQAANLAKSEFIATISHELRTPLQSIMGFSELGMHFARGQKPFDGMFTDIHSGGQRMLKLVNGLLDTSRFDNQHHALITEPQGLQALVDDVCREMAVQLGVKQQQLNQHWPGEAVWAKVDAFRFQQVIRNVLSNAIRFAPTGSTIQIEVGSDDGQHWRIRVSDEGPGIPENELEAIFLPFVQSSRTRDGSGGTGLGLHICRRIMQAHQGSISASNNLHGGSCFTLRLPKTPGAQPAATRPSVSPHGQASAAAHLTHTH